VVLLLLLLFFDNANSEKLEFHLLL